MTSITPQGSFETPERDTERAWVVGSVILAALLGLALVEELKVALASVILFLAVIVPVLVIGVQVRATVILLLGILFLAPEIQLAPDLPRIIGDEVLLYITALLIIAARVVATEPGRSTPMPAAGKALLLFFPLTLLTMAYGAARFGINPVRGDYFEFVKFGKYVLALYVASSVRVDRRFLVRFSWAVAAGGFVAALTAILQSFDFPGVRAFFQLVYYSANADNAREYLTFRAAGTIGNPNELALFVVAGLVFAITLLYLTNRPGQRMLLALFALADSMAILLSGSRMGLLCGALGVALVLMRAARRRTGVIMLVVTSALISLLVLLAMADVSNLLPLAVHDLLWPLLNRVERFSPRHFVDVLARFGMWQVAWSQTQASLLLGYGPAKGALFLLTSATVDSEIFIVALRYGLVGLMVWIGIWVSFLRTARQAANTRERASRLVGRALWSILVVNLLASSVTYTFLVVRRMTLLVLFVGLTAAIARTGVDEGRADARAHD